MATTRASSGRAHQPTDEKSRVHQRHQQHQQEPLGALGLGLAKRGTGVGAARPRQLEGMEAVVVVVVVVAAAVQV